LRVRDNCVVVSNELEDGDAFSVVICNKPLHRCMENFNHGWGSTWYEGDMILGGIWYKRMVRPSTQNLSYMLFKDAHLVVTYSHCVIKSKFPMLLNATRKAILRFKMLAHIKENIYNLIENSPN
jgi:hypothetical protein